MSDGEAALDAMIARLRRAKRIAEAAARMAAPLLEAEVKRTAAAGTTPEGEPWLPLKGGGRALPEAASAVSARAIASSAVLILKGPYVLHNFGTGHAPKRRILPNRGVALPPNLRAIALFAAQKAFAQVMGAR